MTDPFFRSGSTVSGGLDRVTFDAGLRGHMQRVFAYMGGGLAMTGALAWVVAHTALAQIIYGTPLQYVVMFAPLVFVLVMQFRMQSLSLGTLQILFWAFCGTMGLSLGSIFLVYTDTSVARAFFATAADFGAMALYGYATKRDLTGMGAFMMMGLLGILIASIVNIFLMSSMMQWVVSIMSILIFTGLTAYDTQRIKQSYAESYGSDANNKMAVFGALSLYLDFINIFMSLLRLTGDRR
ncbi:MAG: Bax inhibitor-1/YccA family protein [Alphaproteobacteria bacterium]|nr:Bax inhibitor-1/YccA family protein [Alphaproteobacteria bacterium]